MRQSRLVIVVMMMVLFAMIVPAGISTKAAEETRDDDVSGINEGSVKAYDLFEFEAFIHHDHIKDGTAPFDADDEPGDDSSDHNKIVRSWDTVTYPLKITINPKKDDVLKNIKLKITGTLDNGITGKRVNAKFAVGSTQDLDKKEVRFEQDYTIERTGNSVMIPVAIEVLGAKPGVVLTPKIQVQVVSVDGKDITSDHVTTEFNDLPGVMVSAKVNIKPFVGQGLLDSGFPFKPYSKMLSTTGGENDETGVWVFAVSWGVDKLPGKSDMRGATFPDPNGKINYTIKLYGDVYWSGGPNKNRSERFDFDGRDKPMKLFDHEPVNSVYRTVGSPNTLSEGLSYDFGGQSRESWAPLSSMLGLSDSQRKSAMWNSVMDSGTWRVSKPDQERYDVTYHGENTGFTIGDTFPVYRANYEMGNSGYYFGTNEKVFSSRSFLVDMPNEYRIGGKNNPHDYNNNEYHRVTVTLDNYTDENGNVTYYGKQGSSTHTLRHETGDMSAYGTFKAYPYQGYRNPNGYLSSKQRFQWANSVGDAAVLPGEDVYFESRVIPATGMNLYGGWQGVWKWNTDAFELTKNYADEADRSILARGYRNLVFDWVVNDRAKQKNYYGVAKSQNNEFQAFMEKGIDDYNWYDTYDEAVKHGPVGAIQSDVRAPVGGIKSEPVYIPLRVKNENIGFGSETKNGTPLVAAIEFYAYPDAERKQRIDVNAYQTHHHPSKWDDRGNLLDMQTPVGGSVNFESLGVVPAKIATDITSDKDSYYNSETIHWTANNSIVLPEFGVPEGIDAGVKVTHTLPKGLNYKPGTGKIDGNPAEPEIVKNSDGTTSLVWSLFISNQTHKIPVVKFDTTINPFALSENGVSSSVEVKSVIESDLDGRPEKDRTSSKSVTILKVGMVGVYESIDKTYGNKNSDFTLTLSPYTTVEDEEGVTGLTNLPASGDRLGSDFAGSVKMKSIDLTQERANHEPVNIYLNRKAVYNDHPNKIDVSQDGWYLYTGDPRELDGAKSLLFKVEGKMTNRDNIKIDVHVETRNNHFGDTYVNETTINSDTDYRLSPVSNRVRYAIRADLELALERFQIFTNKANSGLPARVRVRQTVLNPNSVKDLPITLAIYDKDSGKKVTEKTYTPSTLKSENDLTIPASTLKKADMKHYEARIEGFDDSKIWVRDGEGSLITDGYTAKEQTLTASDANQNGDILFKDVVMTEREMGKNMAKYYETLKINKISEPHVKSGYGFPLSMTLDYTNDMMNDVAAKVKDVQFTSNVKVLVPYQLLDPSIEYYDASKHYKDGDTVSVPLLRTDVSGMNKMSSSFALPEIYLKQGGGSTYTANQKENGKASGELIEAGRKLYVPVWIDKLGDYNVTYASEHSIGSHFVNFTIDRNVHVTAYMFAHEKSQTINQDELLIEPMPRSDKDW